MIYIVMREEGLISVGWYRDSEVTVCSVWDSEEKACQELLRVCKLYHAEDEKPIRGRYTNVGETERVYHIAYDLEDKFWIEEMFLNLKFATETRI